MKLFELKANEYIISEKTKFTLKYFRKILRCEKKGDNKNYKNLVKM